MASTFSVRVIYPSIVRGTSLSLDGFGNLIKCLTHSTNNLLIIQPVSERKLIFPVSSILLRPCLDC